MNVSFAYILGLLLLGTPHVGATPAMPKKVTLQEQDQKRFDYHSKSTAELESLAQDHHALNELGERYFFGKNGAPLDRVKAAQYYKRAAEAGSAVAANHLAGSYVRGDGVKADPKEARKWYDRSVALDGSLENRCINGVCDNKLLCALLMLANTHGNGDASLFVAHFYAEGSQGFPKDKDRSLYYLERVEKHLEHGNADAFHTDPEGLEGYRAQVKELRKRIQAS